MVNKGVQEQSNEQNKEKEKKRKKKIKSRMMLERVIVLEGLSSMAVTIISVMDSGPKGTGLVAKELYIYFC